MSFNIHNDNIKYSAATSLQGRLLVHVVAGTLGADDVLAVLELQFYIRNKNLKKTDLNESLAHHGDLALVAEEALVVPGLGLEGHELGAAQPALAWPAR